MTENKSSQKKLLSKRAIEFLSNPRHACAADSKAFLTQKKWSWHFALENRGQSDLSSDKILTLSYTTQGACEIELLFLETIARLVLGRNLAFLLSLSFREIENFLRDENHLPAFLDSSSKELKESFIGVKDSLLEALINGELKKTERQGALLKDWHTLTLVEKNKKVRIFIDQINRLFPEASPIRLALAGEEEIAIVLSDFPINISVLEKLICRAMNGMEDISCVKVVAVQ